MELIARSGVVRGMIRACLATALASAIAINLSGCDRQAPAAPEPTASLDSAETTPPPWLASPSDLPGPDSDPAAASRPAPAAQGAVTAVPSTSSDPAQVAQAWASAVEARDWQAVRAYWGDHGARSNLSPHDFAAQWSRLVQPRVTIAPGEQEGAAGSLYYTVPVTIVDGPNRIRGTIVLRRVNDVDGASPEQLRWHLESTTLAI